MATSKKKLSRKIVYFLGAGASFGAGAVATVQGGGKIPIPTQATFWDTFLRFVRRPKNRRVIESFLFRYFLGYAKVPPRSKPGSRRRMLRDIDVEEVFTFLSERARAPATSASLRTYALTVWSALLAEMHPVFSRFKGTRATRKVFHSFIDNFVRSRDTIVSFNYDTVFEGSVSPDPWHYVGVGTRTGGIRILKPHGSINWQDGPTIRVRRTPNRCVVVAPTHLKFVQTAASGAQDPSTIGYLDHSKQINAIWSRMESEMREAKVLVFIGYSFPVADLYFSSVLRSVLAERGAAPGIAIVNPDAVAIQKRLAGRFSLGQTVLRYDLSNFVQGTRAQLLKDLHA